MKSPTMLSKGFATRLAMSFLISALTYFIMPFLFSGTIYFWGPLLVPVYFLWVVVNGLYNLVIAAAVFALAFWFLGYYFQ